MSEMSENDGVENFQPVFYVMSLGPRRLESGKLTLDLGM